MRQPYDRQVRAGTEHERDRDRRQLREAREHRASQLRRSEPDESRHRRQPADPERRGSDVHPVGELGLPRRARIHGVVAGDRQAADEHRRH